MEHDAGHPSADGRLGSWSDYRLSGGHDLLRGRGEPWQGERRGRLTVVVAGVNRTARRVTRVRPAVPPGSTGLHGPEGGSAGDGGSLRPRRRVLVAPLGRSLTGPTGNLRSPGHVTKRAQL